MMRNVLYGLLIFFVSSICYSQSFFGDSDNLSAKKNNSQTNQTIKNEEVNNEPAKHDSLNKNIITADNSDSSNKEEPKKLIEENKKNENIDKQVNDLKKNDKQKNEKTVTDQQNTKKAQELVNLAVELMSEKSYRLAEKKLQEARKFNPDFPIIYCNLAVIDIHMNSIDAAFENLETCFMKGFKKIDMIENDSDFEILVKDRRFQALKNRYQ